MSSVADGQHQHNSALTSAKRTAIINNLFRRKGAADFVCRYEVEIRQGSKLYPELWKEYSASCGADHPEFILASSDITHNRLFEILRGLGTFHIFRGRLSIQSLLFFLRFLTPANIRWKPCCLSEPNWYNWLNSVTNQLVDFIHHLGSQDTMTKSDAMTIADAAQMIQLIQSNVPERMRHADMQLSSRTDPDTGVLGMSFLPATMMSPRGGATEKVTCTICMDCVLPPAATITSCGHVFHRECITRTIGPACCPNCRCSIVDASSYSHPIME